MNADELTVRVAALEQRFADVEKAKGIAGPTGPRGPAGPIDAAVKNAAAAANKGIENSEARLKAVVGDTHETLKAENEKLRTEVLRIAAKLREEVASLREFLDERISNTVVNATVKTLQDYYLLDENCSPTHWNKV